MEQHKVGFIEFLLRTGALRIGGEYKLKSGRLSPWFVNIGDFNDGLSTKLLGEVYAAALDTSQIAFDSLYGIPEKGSALAVATSIGLTGHGLNVPWFFTRKVPKEYGEATKLSQADRIKALVVGRAPKPGQKIAQLDDVFTAGDAKYEARAVLESLGDFEYPVLAIAVDRQEVAIDGGSAILEYQDRTKTTVISVVNAAEVLGYLRENGARLQSEGLIPAAVDVPAALTRMAHYMRVYGVPAARAAAGTLEQRIIPSDRSVIPACDVETLEQLKQIVKQTAAIPGIGGYKIGFDLGLGYGLPAVVGTIREFTDKPIIYDHQKAGTDIPDTGKNFARRNKQSGVDTVILFPQAGPETERAWIYHALDQGLNVIVGGRMTHPAYAVSEGGFISDSGAEEMYRIAARAGITNFVVPGNKIDVIKRVREVVADEGIANPTLWAPGFVEQGGKISAGAKAAGPNFHAIVGRGIYEAQDMRAAAVEHTSQLNSE